MTVSKRKLAAATIALSTTLGGLAFAAPQVHAEPLSKVWVCKFVQTPTVREVLKDGKNPISVSMNATVGNKFNDAQVLSVVLKVDDGGAAPTIADCQAWLNGDSDWGTP